MEKKRTEKGVDEDKERLKRDQLMMTVKKNNESDRQRDNSDTENHEMMTMMTSNKYNKLVDEDIIVFDKY